jgi:hypothetical protein
MNRVLAIIAIMLLMSCGINETSLLSSDKRPYLVVYDYGMGGVWLLIDARSTQEIESKFPKLKAYEDKPDWMTEEDKAQYVNDVENINYHWDIDKKPTGWLEDL